MPRADVLFPLVQVFEPIVYLRAVEDDNPPAAELAPLCQKIVEQGIVSYDCPAPLDDNRDRFLQLVHDLQHRRDDYAGQLSNLSLAGLGSRKTESKTTIISTLLKETGVTNERDEERMQILWQARLVLKLGEIFDREQTDLQEHLDQIASRENGLIKELRKEDSQPFSLTQSLAAADAATDGQLRLRLKAWSRLSGLGNTPPAAGIYITTSHDSFDPLLEQYEQDQGIVPQPLLHLMLPCCPPDDEAAVDQRSKFQQDAADYIATLRNILAQPAPISDSDRKMLEGQGSPWAALLEQQYPAAEYGRCTLSLSHLAGISPGRFFLETFGRDEDEILEIPDIPSSGMVIGILERQQQ
jgi:hypothetical protein